ncbi:MAG: NusA-like transcription termination signal-binding factor [Candidatus Micrarchaeota archaeon]
MTNTLDRNSLELMQVFEQRTHAKVQDVIEDKDQLVFIVQEGEMGKAIGKGGSTLMKTREAFKPRNVEVIEDAPEAKQMIEKTLRGAVIRNIVEENNKITISVDPQTRGVAIGKSGANIKKLKLALKRRFGIVDAKIL